MTVPVPHLRAQTSQPTGLCSLFFIFQAAFINELCKELIDETKPQAVRQAAGIILKNLMVAKVSPSFVSPLVSPFSLAPFSIFVLLLPSLFLRLVQLFTSGMFVLSG